VRRKSAVLTDQELEIMKVIWQRGEATVRDVYEDLLSRRKVAYTTVMTMLGVLEGKGHVEKVTGDRAYVYRPSRPKQEVITSMATDFVFRVFNGSPEDLIQHLIASNQISREQIKQILNAELVEPETSSGLDKVRYSGLSD
jgi:BlaI family transcriptional regulator, penicillinase repressor